MARKKGNDSVEFESYGDTFKLTTNRLKHVGSGASITRLQLKKAIQPEPPDVVTGMAGNFEVNHYLNRGALDIGCSTFEGKEAARLIEWATKVPQTCAKRKTKKRR